MIKESLFFLFNNEKSSDYNVISVNQGSDLYEESFAANRTIRETKVKNNDIPYFEGLDTEPLSFPLTLYVNKKFNEFDLSNIKKWLYLDNYAPLSFEADIDKVFYVLFHDVSTLKHNARGEGYITVQVRCDSPFSYSHIISSPIYNTADPLIKVPIEIDNNGELPIMPVIHIEKTGNGSIEIENLSSYDSPFKIEDLQDGEKVTIDCANELIETSLLGISRYDSSNEEYIKLPVGINRLNIKGSCIISFEYEFKYF
ncbi:Phage-related protein [Terribacillus aidingensis]|uniref:Phage-related protein n=1 Tax=Terribacillus aidingensis TaxID=586416 RepID=A0A285NKC6_9BACI|nr:phage tail domain-containing protein [Terribacillus aidingensis]SNZ09919.1 Phage-related protein [Terribacillus aidingensis]